MTKTLSMTLIAGLLLAGAAQASGDYYAGASTNEARSLDTMRTGSIGHSLKTRFSATAASAQTVESGDYYHGASRHN